MVEMATRQHTAQANKPERPLSLAEIAAAQQLSVAYLEQLFARLRRSGLVASARGPGGGYRLARPPECIPIAAIIEAVDEPIHATRCEDADLGCLAGGRRCLTHDLWSELGEQIRCFLAGVTLADVVESRVVGRAAPPRPAGESTEGATAAPAAARTER
jgi:Rrf2 family iron-sulfur cluster assembly transcriptional regulator